MYDHLKGRYRSILDLVSDNTPDLAEMGSVGRILATINHMLECADLEPAQWEELTVLRDETTIAVEAARHQAQVDNAAAIAKILGSSSSA